MKKKHKKIFIIAGDPNFDGITSSSGFRSNFYETKAEAVNKAKGYIASGTWAEFFIFESVAVVRAIDPKVEVINI